MTLADIRRVFSMAVAGILAWILAAAPSNAFEASYIGSVQFDTGEYFFDERANSFYFYNGLDLDSGRLNLSANIPIIIQDSPWIAFTGSGLMPHGGGTSGYSSLRSRFPERDTVGAVDMGLGDLYITGGLDLIEISSGRPNVQLTGSVKVPVANENEGFGTGEWDFGAGLSISYFMRSIFLAGEVGYWTFGDMPDLEFDDVVSYSFSIGKPFSGGKMGLMASIYGYTDTFEDIDGPIQVALGFNYLTDSGSGLTAGAAIGLTESAADLSVTAGWSVPLTK